MSIRKVTDKKLKDKAMEGITEFEGVPHILGVPCVRDRYYRFSSAEFLGLTEWLCPHCFTNLSESDGEMVCLNECHLGKPGINKSTSCE